MGVKTYHHGQVNILSGEVDVLQQVVWRIRKMFLRDNFVYVCTFLI